MKIAIFGDSYAQPYSMPLPYKNKTWHVLLQNEFTVDNYAIGGTGCEWSNVILQEMEDAGTLRQYDKIIFIVSSPVRLWLHPEYQQQDNSAQHVMPNVKPTKISGYFMNNKSLQNKIYTTARDYYRLFGNPKLYSQRLRLLVENLRYTYENNILLLFSLNDQIYEVPWDMLDCNIPMVNLQGDKFVQFNSVNRDVKLYEDTNWELFKCNHMTVESHLVFYNKVKEWIENGSFNYIANEEPILKNTDEEYIFYLKCKGMKTDEIIQYIKKKLYLKK